MKWFMLEAPMDQVSKLVKDVNNLRIDLSKLIELHSEIREYVLRVHDCLLEVDDRVRELERLNTPVAYKDGHFIDHAGRKFKIVDTEAIIKAQMEQEMADANITDQLDSIGMETGGGQDI